MLAGSNSTFTGAKSELLNEIHEIFFFIICSLYKLKFYQVHTGQSVKFFFVVCVSVFYAPNFEKVEGAYCCCFVICLIGTVHLRKYLSKGFDI